MRWHVLFVAAFLLAPATASAQRVEDTFFNSVIPSRVDHLIGFTPTTFAIHPVGQRVVPITVRVGGRTHRYTFGNAAAAVGPSANIYMRNMIRARRYPSPEGIFLDRRLKASERRHVRVRADLGRDADVLAVSSGHPACASGVSRAAARGIAAGTIRTWSEAGVPTPASGDAIALRRAGTGVDRFVEPRFRAGSGCRRGAGCAQRRPVRGSIGQPRHRGRDELVASPCVPRDDVRGPGRRGGAKRRFRARAVAPRRLPDLVRDATAPPPGGPDRRRLPEVPHGPARHGVLPPARDAPRQGSVAGAARSVELSVWPGHPVADSSAGVAACLGWIMPHVQRRVVPDDEFGDGRLLLRDRFIHALVVDPCVDRFPRLTPYLALANLGAKSHARSRKTGLGRADIRAGQVGAVLRGAPSQLWRSVNVVPQRPGS